MEKKLCSRVELKTDGTAFPNNDRPRLVKNSFFFLKLDEMFAKGTRNMFDISAAVCIS